MSAVSCFHACTEGLRSFDGLSALLVWAWHHTSPIHARVRVAEASTREKGASNAASKEDDMNSQRMFTVQKSLRGDRCVCEQPFRVVEG